MSAPPTVHPGSPSRLQRLWRSRAKGDRVRWLKPALLLAGAGILGSLVCFFAYPHLRAYYHWRQAEAAVEQLDFVSAREHLETCLKVWPDSAETHFHLARVCRRAREVDSAAKHLSEAERLGYAGRETALENLLLQAHSGDVRQVEETLVQYLQTGHREEVLIFEALLEGLLQIHYLPEAERWSTVWLERYPHDWRPYYFRGRTFDLGVKVNRAIEDYQAALERKPDAFEVHQSLGELQREKGLLNEALPHLRYCHERRPDDPTVVVSLARCHRMLGDPNTARQLLDRWLEANGRTHVGVVSLRGRVERDLSEPERALPWLRKAEELAPRDGATLSMLVNVLRELGQEEEAKSYERKVEDVVRQVERLNTLTLKISNSPDDVAARSEIGVLLIRLGHVKPAYRWLMSALELSPGHAPTHLALAEYHEAIGDPQQARNHRLAAEGKLRARLR